ncbi:hypothetical protein [Cryobacterium ruanii]|uniref:Uncharacterized protein n=1 Tax=Cryobacterium ruanii TaxID=1259197 RepID=A0A4R9ALR3_9MICO|nr:hypothetical protein [Cryobacterium ruanii]TFD64359.1 hypothetical protein E3T47_12910 [Cryobacterium ruanii]
MGRIIWPRHIADLTDTTLCPACHTPLKSPICSACRLDLRHATATALLDSSADAAAALEKRAELIGHIRYETETGPISTPVQPRATVSAGPRTALPVGPPVFDPAASTRVARALSPPQPPPPQLPVADLATAVPGRPQRSSVQVVLLSIGVLLVSVAAIFFLTVAWIVAGLVSAPMSSRF